MKSIHLVSILLVVMQVAGQNKNSNYIKLDFVYEHTERPLPTVFFFVDSPEIKRDPIYHEMFRFTKKEFKTIENVIAMNSSYLIIDTLTGSYYEIEVIKKGKKTVYGTVNLRKTKELFSKILETIRYSKNYLEVSRVFEYLYSNLKPSGIIKG